MAELKTIEVKNWKKGGKGILIINEDDFDPKIHELADAPEKPKKKAAPKVAAKKETPPVKTTEPEGEEPEPE
ncbi:MAG: hypothetical protein AMK71_04135 [Nitrospira bacterium SG8_35_4]|nr:MAG: hypothetical protein AMK71_04135 [Nitrospira bacterium SG8_35_4]